MFFNDFVEGVPYDRGLLLDELLCNFNGGGSPPEFELLVDERPEKLEPHLLRNTALVESELGAHGDNRTARIVHSFSEEVLPEPSLFSLYYVA